MIFKDNHHHGDVVEGDGKIFILGGAKSVEKLTEPYNIWTIVSQRSNIFDFQSVAIAGQGSPGWV